MPSKLSETITKSNQQNKNIIIRCTKKVQQSTEKQQDMYRKKIHKPTFIAFAIQVGSNKIDAYTALA